MSYYNVDVHSEFFTPQEFPVEVLETAKHNNVVACCLPPHAKQFLSFMLFKEFYYKTNGICVFIHDSQKKEAVAKNEPKLSSEMDEDPEDEDVKKSKEGADLLKKLQSPSYISLDSLSSIQTIYLDNEDTEDFSLTPSSVIFCSRKKFLQLLNGTKKEEMAKSLVLLVIDNVQEALINTHVKEELREIFKTIRMLNVKKNPSTQIRLVCLTVSLLQYYGNQSSGFWRMERTFKKLEYLCGAKVDTSSDTLALLRYSTIPSERIVQFEQDLISPEGLLVKQEVKCILGKLKDFLNDHVYDPIELFGVDDSNLSLTNDEIQLQIEAGLITVEEIIESETISEELKRVTNPKLEPFNIISRLEWILDQFGPWSASRALVILLQMVEKLRVRTPYERHYLILGVLHTRLIMAQERLYNGMSKFSALESLEKFSTPKLLAVLSILRRFDMTQTPQLEKSIAIEEPDDEEENETPIIAKHKQGLGHKLHGNNRRKRYDARRNFQKPDNQQVGIGEDVAQKEKNLKILDSEIQIKDEKVQENDTEKLTEKVEPSSYPEEEDKKPSTDVSQKKAKGHKKSFTKAKKSDANPELQIIENEEAKKHMIDEPLEEKKDVEKEVKFLEIGKSVKEKSAVVEDNNFKRPPRRTKSGNKVDENALCGIVLLENRFDARILFHFLKEAAYHDPRLLGLNPTIAICSNPDYSKDSREAEMEHKKREDSLRRFRYREANLLLGTSLLEDGIELPKPNLVIRFDSSKSFRSYLFSKGRAQGFEGEFYIFSSNSDLPRCLEQIATYKLVEETFLSYSIIPRPSPHFIEGDWISQFPRFKSATLSNAIAIVNRYCARLPSDTFTRLAPIWNIELKAAADDQDDEKGENECERRYTCSLRLPINSPVKWTISGVPMPSEVLAKRAVALQTVLVLHSNGEIDDDLLPIGKEGVTQEPDLVVEDLGDREEIGEFRPGSTKRRQYYDKQLASQLISCLPSPATTIWTYWLKMTLVTPIPEEQNTRGRRIHPPQEARQSFGIILSKEIPPTPPFPIYTRCGEVLVELVPLSREETLTDVQLEKISAFHHYSFTSVLRLDKYLTLFDPKASENSYFVVPLKRKLENGFVNEMEIPRLDWEFMDIIWKAIDPRLQTSSDERTNFIFNVENYEDAVVSPWYRNNDIPQYFYVAEICASLTPRSQFPGCEFKTFEEYYQRKYHIKIADPSQPLLDVDHTSARLNFLTPRYVNRKGMALPTSSENTKKAKRENLEQKQILIPELCAIHPFRASLWRQAVSLPCILYRLNALLLANNVRAMVATHVHSLGLISLPGTFKWEPLTFGWSLNDVILEGKKSEDDLVEEPIVAYEKEEEKKAEEKIIDENKVEIEDLDEAEFDEKEKKREAKKEESGFAKAAKEGVPLGVTLAESLLLNDKLGGKSVNEILCEKMKKCRPPTLEIGTWTNDLAGDACEDSAVEVDEFDEDEDELMDPNVALPSNLMMLDKNWTWGGRSRLFNHRVHRALYGSPTHWGEVWDQEAFGAIDDMDELNIFDGDNMSINSDMSGGSEESFLDEENNLKIQFHNGNTAEALDKRKFPSSFDQRPEEENYTEDLWWVDDANEEELKREFEKRVQKKIGEIQTPLRWEEIINLPVRNKKIIEPIDHEDKLDPPNPHYETLFKVMTPIEPLTIYSSMASSQLKSLTESPHVSSEEPLNEVDANEEKAFSFDHQPQLSNHIGPSPCLILQAMTMSNANDGLNLERLETIGDSFLKYAITSYLFCTFENIHEGKLSHLRSKQVSNVHLYRLGRRRGLGGLMVSAKFEPHDNWLPPCYHIPKDLDKALIQSKVPPGNFSMAQVRALKDLPFLEIEEALKSNPTNKFDTEFIPYNLVTQQSIPDKSIADCVEALIGAYLTSTGPTGALLFMSWLGMRVLPSEIVALDKLNEAKKKTEECFYMDIFQDPNHFILFHKLQPPKSPLLRYGRDSENQLSILLKGYEIFEESINYKFVDRSYLLQAFSHASYSTNNLTDCYQRLEFLGDAILDYLITRHLYEDPLQHSPGSLTDLRSALVNNTIFASLAVKNEFHKYFRHSSPGLSTVLQKFVTFQEQHGHTLTQDYYLMGEEECEEAEDIEVPKALGDVFESVAGAIFLDSGMSLDAVWNVYYRIMKKEIEQFSQNVPKSPIRELLEMEPETAKFGKPEKLWDGRRVRVSVEIFGIGTFRGIGRNYRIAKCTAAKCALRHVRKIRNVHKNLEV